MKSIQKLNYSFLYSIESPHFNLILKFNKILSKFYLINGTFFKRINILSIDKKTVKQFKKYIRLLKKILKKIKKKDKKINKNKSHLINLSKIIKLKTIKYLIIMKLVLFKNTKSFKNKKI
jgi:cell shape-determining protein MreC